MDSILKQITSLYAVGLMVIGLMLALTVGCGGDQPTGEPTGQSGTKSIRLRVRVDEFVSTSGKDGWESFHGVYKCTVEDTFGFNLTKKGQSINVVVGIVDPPVGKMVLGSSQVIYVDDDLPKGWESIADEFNNRAFGLVALRKVEK